MNDQTLLTSVNSTAVSTTVSESAGDSSAQDIAAIHGSLAFTDEDIDDNLAASASLSSVRINGNPLSSKLSDAAANALTAALDHLSLGTGVISTGGGTQTISWTWDPTAANLDFLKVGDQLTITYAMQVGDSASQNLVFAITGANDQTVLTSVNSTAVSTAVSELAGDSSAQDIAAISGSLAFTDEDIGDNLAASASLSSVRINGNPLSSKLSDAAANALTAALDHLSLGTGVISTGGGTQTISWTWDPTAANLDFLKVGDQLTITYAMQVGDSASQNLVFAITGANDQTVLTSVNSTAVSTAVSESAGDSSAQDIAAISGSLAFTDEDIGDNLTASASLSSVRINGNPLGSKLSDAAANALTAALDHLSLGTGVISTGGGTQTISWTWDPTAANLDFLKVGDQLTITYAMQVGDSASQNLVFAITGANDQTVLTSVNSTAVSTAVSELAAIPRRRILPRSPDRSLSLTRTLATTSPPLPACPACGSMAIRSAANSAMRPPTH